MQSDSPNAGPLKRRRGFQFSLRNLLALVALAALACAIAFPMVRKWQRVRAIQEKANEELKAIVKPIENASNSGPMLTRNSGDWSGGSVRKTVWLR